MELSGSLWLCAETSAVRLSSVPKSTFPSSPAQTQVLGEMVSHAEMQAPVRMKTGVFWVSPQKQPALGQHFLRRFLGEAYTYC